MLERFVAIQSRDQYRSLLQELKALVVFYVNAIECKKEIKAMDSLLETPEMSDIRNHANLAYVDLRDAPQLGDSVEKSGTITVFKNGEIVSKIKGEGLAR